MRMNRAIVMATYIGLTDTPHCAIVNMLPVNQLTLFDELSHDFHASCGQAGQTRGARQ